VSVPARGPLAYVLLDVFTDTPLEGNPLAVFPDARQIEPADMQRIARELNLSETVFVMPAEQGGDARIRIFTPAAELPFAGHPVLGSAIALAGERGLEELTLETGSGPVAVSVTAKAGGGLGWMLQPIPTWMPYQREDELLAALGLTRSGLPVEVYDNGPHHAYVELADEDAVAALAPDLSALAALGAVGVSCFAGSGTHWKTRMFIPALGVAEDPATGSAAGPLALHLCRHGRIRWGDEIEIRQGAEILRPSLLRARVEGSSEGVQSVAVGGGAVLVGRGELEVAVECHG
jgi:trans-2,3-dihydro-3-hydroxyanthranilate isomerase